MTGIDMNKAVLGIELGSTRIKAVLLDETLMPAASGSFSWQDSYENGVWTYSMDAVWRGLAACYADLKADVRRKFGVTLTKVGAIGISAMMHGYLPFNAAGTLLTPFRTWRNTITAEAAEKLTARLGFNIPQRWSIAHLYQAMLNGEAHVPEISYLTTLAGYVHWQLTGEKVLGIGDASGMFPVSGTDYDAGMLASFEELTSPYPWTLGGILPKILCAGEAAGTLTAEGAKRLDPEGDLASGIPLCPPEGDAGTGMTATNSVDKRTGNISAGTSIFSMAVLEKPLKKVHTEIDMVTTPDGSPVAMVHCNNCTSDLNAWVGVFGECLKTFGADVDADTLYGTLFAKALEGDTDCGGVIACNYFSGEPVLDVPDGRPFILRRPDVPLTLANLMRANLYASMATLKSGMDILLKDEGVTLDTVFGHGGLFRTRGVAQGMLAAAIRTPVSVMETAGEGGPYGMALLAAYMLDVSGMTLGAYLREKVFDAASCETVQPDETEAEGFDRYNARFIAALPVERAAIQAI